MTDNEVGVFIKPSCSLAEDLVYFTDLLRLAGLPEGEVQDEQLVFMESMGWCARNCVRSLQEPCEYTVIRAKLAPVTSTLGLLLPFGSDKEIV